MSNETIVVDWDKCCPKCKSTSLFGTPVANTNHWVYEYLCTNCLCKFTVNFGDKMGGGFDVITLI